MHAYMLPAADSLLIVVRRTRYSLTPLDRHHELITNRLLGRGEGLPGQRNPRFVMNDRNAYPQLWAFGRYARVCLKRVPHSGPRPTPTLR